MSAYKKEHEGMKLMSQQAAAHTWDKRAQDMSRNK